MPIGDPFGKPGVLLNQENGDARLPDFFKDRPDLPNQHRCQSFRGFVQKHELEVHGENSSDGQHLLLTTGELGSFLVFPFSENRKVLVDLFEIPKTFLASFGR